MKMYAYVGIKIQYTILFVQNTVFKIYMDLNPNICICIHFHTYVIDIKIKIYIYKLIWFRTGHQARFASHLVQNGDSKRVSRVNLVQQSANHLVQFGTSEHRAHVCVCIYIYGSLYENVPFCVPQKKKAL